jgi:hypothetical protein
MLPFFFFLLALFAVTTQMQAAKAIALNYDCIFPVTIFAGTIMIPPRPLLCENPSCLLLSRMLLG